MSQGTHFTDYQKRRIDALFHDPTNSMVVMLRAIGKFVTAVKNYSKRNKSVKVTKQPGRPLMLTKQSI